MVPCFNGINTLHKIIDNIQNSPVDKKEIIIVDEFSDDLSREFLKKVNSQNMKTFFHDKNLGKDAAIYSRIAIAKGDIIIIQDADLEYDPNEFPKNISPIIDLKADFVYVSRFKWGQPDKVVYFWQRIGDGYFTLLSNIFTDINLSDMETCHKAFKKEIIQNIKIEENRLWFAPEITTKIAKLNCRIYKVGIFIILKLTKRIKRLVGEVGFKQFGVF